MVFLPGAEAVEFEPLTNNDCRLKIDRVDVVVAVNCGALRLERTVVEGAVVGLFARRDCWSVPLDRCVVVAVVFCIVAVLVVDGDGAFVVAFTFLDCIPTPSRR